MRNSTIGTNSPATAKISDSLQNVILHSIRDMVSDDLIEQTCQEVSYHFRKRKITPVVTVLHMILSALWPEESFNACWQYSGIPSSVGFLSSKVKVPLGDVWPMPGADCRWKLWSRLFGAISQQAQPRSDGYDCWNGHRVALADGRACP